MNVSSYSKAWALEVKVLLKLCEQFQTVRSLTVTLLCRYGEWDQLAHLSIDPKDYNDPLVFRDDALITGLLSKNPRLPLSTNTREAGFSRWLLAEEQCRNTNRNLRAHLETNLSQVRSDIRSVVHTVQQDIQTVLRPFASKRDLAYVEESMRFGPGATTSTGCIVSSGYKYSSRMIDCTPELVSFGLFCAPHLWRRNLKGFNVVKSSKLTFVPKNAKTDRAICIEPDLNIFVQLGFGALLRERLLRLGISIQGIEGQPTVNRELARKAFARDLATVDLSMASDTLSYEAVKLLLPPRWFDALSWCRCETTTYEETEYRLNKFSSMGNGFTFELETLIFHCIAVAACKEIGVSTDEVSTFGDDIIVPNSALSLLRDTLNFLGFSVNSEKTFGKSAFHESCGKDYFLGIDVRPVFFKDRVEEDDLDFVCYRYANALRSWAATPYGWYACDRRVLPAWQVLYRACRPANRHHIPNGFGDVGFIEAFDRSTPKIDRSRGWAGYSFTYKEARNLSKCVDQYGSYLSSLRQATEFTRGVETLRGRFVGSRSRMGYVLTWPHIGPWL